MLFVMCHVSHVMSCSGDECSEVEDPIKRDETAPGPWNISRCQHVLHKAHSTHHKAHSTQNTAHRTNETAHRTQHTAHSTQNTAHRTHDTAHRTQHTAQYTDNTECITMCRVEWNSFGQQGRLVPVKTDSSHPLGPTALYEGDCYVIQYSVRWLSYILH